VGQLRLSNPALMYIEIEEASVNHINIESITGKKTRQKYAFLLYSLYMQECGKFVEVFTHGVANLLSIQ